MAKDKKEHIHTLILGTSKTEKGKEYYCKGQNKKRFWGTLSLLNSSFKDDEPKTCQLRRNGVMIGDLAEPTSPPEKKDKKIKAESLQNGFHKIQEIIKNEKELKRIGLVGKQAAKWFFFYFLNDIELGHARSRLIKSSLFSQYGEQEWLLKQNSSQIKCYILTNTNRQWKKEVWEDFWREVFSNPHDSKNMRAK